MTPRTLVFPMMMFAFLSGVARAAEPLRAMTFNVRDIRSHEIRDASNARLRAAAEIIQRLRPDVLLLNEIAVDQDDSAPPQNADLFAKNFLAASIQEELAPLDMDSFMAPVNTGVPSGFDLDNNGEAVSDSGDADSDREQAARRRQYGADCWGYGEFAGQYGMALFVRRGLAIERDNARTFRKFKWRQMPGALSPIDPDTGQAWYNAEEWAALRLSSKSHWDVPVKLPDGPVIHFLCSHPTPPVFDGPEDRNGCRNYDEIRFWKDYIDGEDYFRDDQGRAGALAPDALFFVLGDLNADPDEGATRGNPIKQLLTHRRIQGDFVPVAEGVDRSADDTASWGMRVDYVLPSMGMTIKGGGMRRLTGKAEKEVSDHYPVWVDVALNR